MKKSSPPLVGVTQYFDFDALKPDGEIPHAIAGEVTANTPMQHDKLGLCADILIRLKGSGKVVRLVFPVELLTELREEVELPF